MVQNGGLSLKSISIFCSIIHKKEGPAYRQAPFPHYYNVRIRARGLLFFLEQIEVARRILALDKYREIQIGYCLTAGETKTHPIGVLGLLN